MNLLDRIPMAFYTVGYYIRLLVAPYPLLFYYGYDYVPIVGWDSIWTWVAILLLLPLGVFTLLKLKTKHVLIYGLAYFFISISMFSNLVKPVVGIIAERFTYIPSLGFCIVLGWGLYRLVGLSKDQTVIAPKQKNLLRILAVVLVGGSFFYVVNRNSHWDTEVSLASHDIKYLGTSAKANALLGDFLLSEMQQESNPAIKKRIGERAAYFYNQSAKIFSEWDAIYHNLGVIYIQMAENEKAVEPIKKAIALGRKAPNTYYNLGLAYLGQHEKTEAIAAFEEAIKVDSTYLNAYSQLITLNFESQNYDRLFDLNVQALKYIPERRKEIMEHGQKVANIVYGAGTYYYIDRIKNEGLLSAKEYQEYAEKLQQARVNSGANQN